MDFQDSDNIYTYIQTNLRKLEDEEINLLKQQQVLNEHYENFTQDINNSINIYTRMEEEYFKTNMPRYNVAHYDEKLELLKTILSQNEILYNIRSEQIKSKIATNRDTQEANYERLHKLNKS